MNYCNTKVYIMLFQLQKWNFTHSIDGITVFFWVISHIMGGQGSATMNFHLKGWNRKRNGMVNYTRNFPVIWNLTKRNCDSLVIGNIKWKNSRLQTVTNGDEGIFCDSHFQWSMHMFKSNTPGVKEPVYKRLHVCTKWMPLFW